MLSFILMLAFTLAATVTDIRRHTIYNWTTYPGILTAYLVALIVSMTEGDPQMAYLLGEIGLADAALGMFICGGCCWCAMFFSASVVAMSNSWQCSARSWESSRELKWYSGH